MGRILAIAAWAVLVVAIAAGGADAQLAAGPQFMLTGVVVVEGGGRAWLQEPRLTQNQPVSLRPGESIGPYRLTKVFDDRVELVGPGGTLTVPLAGVSSPAPVAVAAPPRPVPPPAEPAPTTGPDRVVVLPPGPPLAPLPPGTPRADFGSLLRGGALPK